jgi:exocyst complex component 4
MLKKFVEDFVENTFVDHVKSDFARRATQTAEASDAFRVRERSFRAAYRADDAFRPLLLGALRTFDSLRQLLDYMSAIPAHATLFGQTASATLVQFLQKCRQRYDDLIEGTEAAKVVRNRSNLQLLTSDPAWKTLKRAVRADRPHAIVRGDASLLQGSLEYDDERFAELQQRMEAPLYRPGIGGEQSRLQFFMDSSRVATLASMSDSLDWLADRFETEADAQPTGAAALAAELPEQLRQLGDQCLLYLHEEFRCHCFFLLDAIRGQSYALDEPPADADLCVLDLNRDLLSSDEMVSALLPQSKRRYLFDGLARLVAQLLIRALADIPRWNHNGVLKMCRNVFALQQNLTPLFGAKEDRLDRTRRYYELLEISEEVCLFSLLSSFCLLCSALFRRYSQRLEAQERKQLFRSRK